MSSLSMMEAELPPGFRFQPTDDELICDYLMKRLSSCEDPSLMIDIVDLNKCEPWDIPETACVGGKQWYFYSQQDRKYATGIRTNRATASGYWKATGKDKMVVKKGRLIGMRKTLVFHKGRAPKGNKTGWVMHEFRLQVPVAPPKLPSSSKDQDWVLCRVFNKSKEEGQSKPSIISQATSSHSYNIKKGSSSLPALTDSHTNHHNVYDEQVPCFSNSSYIPHFFNIEVPKSTSLITAPSIGISSFSAGDEHAVEAVLTQITKMEEDYPNCINMKGSSPVRLGEVVSSESYLCDHMDLTNIWSNHYY